MPDQEFIVHTDKANCQDCYKCVRNCPVKSIRILNGQATVEPERCILCGTCVEICPANAKKYRLDIVTVRQWIENPDEKVYVSLAPSFRTYFADIEPDKLNSAIEKLGFKGVSETALGAEIVSWHTKKLFEKDPDGVYISSACPSVGLLLQKYYPEIYKKHYSPLPSPLGAHGQYLKDLLGKDIKVVFVGPCIAKKSEPDCFDGLDLTLTFEELDKLFEIYNIDARNIDNETPYCTDEARYAKLFPVPGGMIKTIDPKSELLNTKTFAIDGIDELRTFFDQFSDQYKGLFIEVLACREGCLNGPIMRSIKNPAQNRIEFIHQTTIHEDSPSEEICQLPISMELESKPVRIRSYSEERITQTLNKMGKYKPEDELNCNACGYPTCRDHAVAILDGRAELSMCASYMRKLAESKANFLLEADPNGIIILNEKLKIMSSNPSFRKIFQLEEGEIPEYIQDIMPDDDFFEVLTTENKVVNKQVHFPERNITVRMSIFPIESYRLIGAIFDNITSEIVQKKEVNQLGETTIAHAHQVINNQMHTAQQMARMLGDVTAETKILLNELIKLAEQFKQ